MTDRIKAILSDYSGISADEISEETNLVSDLGLSSLDVVNIVVAFEDEFDIEIPDSDIRSLKTVGDIQRYVEEKI